MELVSVIIPTYNHERFIADAIESVLGQSYSKIELIIVNDGSTDGTKDVIEKYRRKNKIKTIHQMKAGPSSARNAGIKIASGNYICFLDSDDIFFPEKVKKQVQFLMKNPDMDLVSTGADVVRLKGGAWEPWYQYLPPKNTSREEQVNKLLKKNFIVCSTVMVRKNLLAKTGLFNENYPRHQDYDMWLRMLAHTKFGSIREVLLKYRWHDQNISRSPAITPIRDHMIEEAKKRFGRI